jgi:hypothetical protein
VKDFELQVDPVTGQPFTTIGGHRVEIRDEAECEEAKFVVCVRAHDDPGTFTDNVHTICTGCGTEIIHRPYAPKTPPKICMDCMVKFERRKDS